MKRFLTLLTCLALAGALVAGCGDDNKDTASAPETTAAPAATTETGATTAKPAGGVVEVKMKDIEFVPADITGKVGDTVKWTNDDAVAHTVTATSGEDFDSGTVEGGGTYEYKLDKAGKIDYVCTIHPNQKGTITVQ